MSVRNTLRRPVAHAVRTTEAAGLRALSRMQPRVVSAMLRVRNEEEYLEAAVRSIVDSVDEVVLVDNLSTDATPKIIRSLRDAYPRKVAVYEYRHRVARQGEENEQLALAPGGLASPNLLANYYNWCLRRCHSPFVLKWDGDMVATSAFEEAALRFRASRSDITYFHGVNLHPDREHLVGGRPFEDVEPRFFIKRFARYDNGLGRCERLSTPYERGNVGIIETVAEPAYVHMRYCKRDPREHLSPQVALLRYPATHPGDPVGDDVRETIARWSL